MPPGVADVQRQRRPTGRAAELDDRGHHRRARQDRGGVPHLDASPAAQQAGPVGERDDPLEAVLGQQHGDAEVAHQAGQRGEHLLGGGGVERGGGLVEDEQARVHGQHGAEGHPLLLTPGEGAQVPGAQVGDAEEVQRLLDPASHRAGGETELLHPVGQLLLHRVGDEARGGVLADVADRVRALAGRGAHHAPPVEAHVALEHAAGEPGHETGDHAEQGGLADPGRSRDEDQLPLLHHQVDAVEHRRRRGGVGHPGVVAQRDPVELDHAATTGARRGAGSTGAAASTGGGAATAATSPSSGPTRARTVTAGKVATAG